MKILQEGVYVVVTYIMDLRKPVLSPIKADLIFIINTVVHE